MKDEFEDMLDPDSEGFDDEPEEKKQPIEETPVNEEISEQEPTQEEEQPEQEPIQEDESEPEAEEQQPVEEQPTEESDIEEEPEPDEVSAVEPTGEEPEPDENAAKEQSTEEPDIEEEQESESEIQDEPIEETPESESDEEVTETSEPEPEDVISEEEIEQPQEPDENPEPKAADEQPIEEPETPEPAEEIIEPPAEENVTEHVIEEIAEQVTSEHIAPEPASHDDDAEIENRPILKVKEEKSRPIKEVTTVQTSESRDGGDGIIYKDIDAVMHDSMIPYSEFVIMDRALPRVEDGLKPVQRRILFAMNDMGLTPDKGFRKSAGIVGECLGKYHPHGDTSVYDAMVRLAQPFNMNMPLVTGQGNFGSDDGDSAAAMRYTEAKLSPLAMELLRDIDKETVPFSLTYDDRNTEPDILPARYPNLLTNGAMGIAVGLATNIPPHNLGELIDAHIAYIENPKITLAPIMKIIKGPDFPTGCWVICGEDLKRAYKEGKGKVIMRAKAHIEVESNDRRNIVITELPYQVNKVVLQRNIADLRENKKGILSGISEIRDETDRNGTRLVIKIRREFDERAILDLLYKYTSLQCNFNFNMVAIADGKPKLLGLLDFISYYVEYQREIVYKRSVFDLNNARERAHILQGLLIAIRNIDEVVRIIKTSKNTGEARERLMSKFDLSERQAQAILDLRLARLTSLEVYKLEEELAELLKLIAYLEKVIASKTMQFDIVKNEMLEIKKKFKLEIERRSQIIADVSEALVPADDDPKPVDEVVVTLTAAATIKRMSAKHFSMSKTEFLDGLGFYDINQVVIQTQTDKLLYIFTNLGNCYKIDVGDVPECKLRERGNDLRVMFKDATEGEKPVAVYAVIPPSDDTAAAEDSTAAASHPKQLVWITGLGMIKRSAWQDACGIQKSTFQCYKLREDRKDTVVRVDELKDNNTIMFISGQGYILNATIGDIPVQGRIASGVKGISMEDTDTAVCSCVAKPNGFVVAVTNKGNVKRVESKGIDKMVRYRKGLQLGGALEKGECVIFGAWVKGEEDLVTKDDKGAVRFIPIADIPVSDRTAKWRPIPKVGKVNFTEGYIHRRKKNN